MLATVCLSFLLSAPAPKPAALQTAWGDQGDGTFVNPILPADYSDIDAIRVGDDYYAISSTLHLSPGMVVLHSRDLVSWRTLGHVVPDVSRIGPELGAARMNRYGRGVWAGAIRHHAGRFWVYFGAPDEGLFMTTATDPAGPWEPLHQVWKVSGWNDPCPFWDDDGQGYLVTTHFARDPVTDRAYDIHLFKLSADGKSLQPGFDALVHHSRGSEANKLYKIDGRYFHLYSEVRDEGRVVMMNRASRLAGPWETRQLNHVDRRVDKEPNQGGLLQVPGGGWWFLTHQGTGDWEGRALVLLPVTWREGWPILGEVGPDGVGNMVWRAAKPIPGPPAPPPPLDDEFDATRLGPQWEWNHEPRPDGWSLQERPGFLRLRAFPPLRPGDLMSASQTLSQRSFRTAWNQVTVKLDVSGLADGQHAGLCHFAKTYSSLGVHQVGGERRLRHEALGATTDGPALAQEHLWLRSTWGHDGQSTYSYSLDGAAFVPLGGAWPLGWGYYRGDRVGVFTYNDHGQGGRVDVDWLRYELTPPGAAAPAGR